jgi:Plasmid pRiA4b ORF-3-like protein
MPVKKNAALAERPLDLVLALLEAYPRLGKSLFPRNTWRQSLVGDEFTDISQELITGLLCSAGPGLLDDFNGIASDMIEARYVLTDLTELQHDSLRRMIAADVTIAMAALHVLGVVVLDREASSVMLTDLGRYAIRRVCGMAQPGDPVLQLRVTLADVDGRPVWRRLVVPAGYTLDRVHGVIQAAMGWQNYHLHTFWIVGREYGPAYLDDELETLDESSSGSVTWLRPETWPVTGTTSATAGNTSLPSRPAPRQMRSRCTRRASPARVRARRRTAAVLAGSPS